MGYHLVSEDGRYVIVKGKPCELIATFPHDEGNRRKQFRVASVMTEFLNHIPEALLEESPVQIPAQTEA